MVKSDSVSSRALKVARRLDQMASRPGRYVVTIDVSHYGRNWTVDFSRLERVSRYWSDLDDRSNGVNDDEF